MIDMQRSTAAVWKLLSLHCCIAVRANCTDPPVPCSILSVSTRAAGAYFRADNRCLACALDDPSWGRGHASDTTATAVLSRGGVQRWEGTLRVWSNKAADSLNFRGGLGSSCGRGDTCGSGRCATRKESHLFELGDMLMFQSRRYRAEEKRSPVNTAINTLKVRLREVESALNGAVEALEAFVKTVQPTGSTCFDEEAVNNLQNNETAEQIPARCKHIKSVSQHKWTGTTPLAVGVLADDQLKQWWDKISPATFAHRAKEQQVAYLPMWRRLWLDRIADECAGKTFAEWGIGGGLLGEYALDNLSVAHYAGIDISSKSLESARKRLTSRIATGRSFSLHNTTVELRSLRPFVFVSQQVMQHFPSREYTDQFLAQVNSSGATIVMLQTKLPSRRHCSRASLDLGFCVGQSRMGERNTTSNDILHKAVYGRADVSIASMVSTGYLERALPTYTLQEPPQINTVNGAAHAYHIFRHNR